jgi:hypothetical protein
MSDNEQRRDFLKKGLALGATLIVGGAGLPCCVRAALAGEAPPGTPSGSRERGIEELGYCGIDCQTECDVYKATQENDLEAKKRIAKGWADGYGVTIKPEDVACDGCRVKGGRVGYHCGTVCDVRKCGRSRGVKSCAVCADFPSCEKQLWKDWPAMHQRTEERRSRMKKGATD